MADAFILDIDGTLVDTNYQHVIAWDRALRAQGVDVPAWRIHRHMGMGGDQLVAALAGEKVEAASGDEIRAAEGERYAELMGEVSVLEGARELLLALRDLGKRVVLASSAKEEEVDHYLDMLGARELVSGWTSSSDVEETKPQPDLVEAAIEKAGTADAVLVGDTPWDAKAARRAGIEAYGVLTGGFSEVDLVSAGASRVYQSVVELRQDLENEPKR